MRQKRAQRRGDSVQQSGLEQTVPARQRPMAAARIKAGLNTAVPSEKQRILHLVPVALGLWRGKDVPHGHIQPADAAQGVRHEALLCRKLCFVGKVPETAAAAPAENRAVRRDAPGAGREDAFDDAKGVTFADFYHLDGKHVAHGGKRDKNGLALKTSDAVAVAGQCVDGKGDDLVFDKRHMSGSPHKKSGRHAALKITGKPC